MVHKNFIKVAISFMLTASFFSVFHSPPGEAVYAFNQHNLIRVAQVHEVDCRLQFQRVAPVYDIHP